MTRSAARGYYPGPPCWSNVFVLDRWIRGLACAIIGLMMVAPLGYAQSVDSELDPARLGQQVAALRNRVTELVGAVDLLDTLHFGWFDRPYARADLAIFFKTAASLERESHWRGLGNGAITDDAIARMFAWADRALARVVGPEPDLGFRPHRFHATIDARSADSVGAPLFAFIDQCTATCASDRLGDLDVLASLGLRAYAFPPGAALDGAGARAKTARARGLGMAVVAVVTHEASAPAGGSGATFGVPDDTLLTLRPLTLRELLDEPVRTSAHLLPVPALVDPPDGEPIASSLARRALARGVLRQRRTMTASWRPATFPSREGTTGVALSMWLHALDGQALGVLPGWRDLRDGTVTPFGSVFLSPEELETVARTALDLLRLGEFASALEAEPVVAISIGPDAIDSREPNRWDHWIEPAWTALLDRQMRFDVVNAAAIDPASQLRYALVMPLRRDDLVDPLAFATGVETQLAGQVTHTRRATLVEIDGSIARELFVRQGRTPNGKPCVGLANLSDRSRRLKLSGADDLEAVRDVIAGEHIEEPREGIDLKPWQVRLLWPTD